jgi:hypothetical protein
MPVSQVLWTGLGKLRTVEDDSFTSALLMFTCCTLRLNNTCMTAAPRIGDRTSKLIYQVRAVDVIEASKTIRIHTSTVAIAVIQGRAGIRQLVVHIWNTVPRTCSSASKPRRKRLARSTI